MNEPNIVPQIGGYLLTFEDTIVKIGRLNVHKDGRVTGELTIWSGDKTILLPPSSFNFSSDRTRASTAKQLGEKYPDAKIEWVELFDYLGYKVQELARQGAVVEEVWASDDAEPPVLLLDPFIYEHQSNIIYGEKGVSKSTLAYAMAMCMGLPWPENPLEIVVPAKPVVTLVLDWETDRKTFEFYLSRLKRGMDVPAVALYYRKCELPLIEELEPIERMIKDIKADVLLIDSLAAAAGGESGELKGSQSALSFNMALRKFNLTSLIIAQTSKDQSGTKKTIFGSAIFTYYARNIFELCRNEDSDSDGNRVHLALFHRECNLGRKHAPMGFCLDFNDANRSLKITRESVTVSEFIGKVTQSNAITFALKKGAKNVKELSDATGIKDTTLRTQLARLKSLDKVIKVDDKWGLLSRQEDLPF